MDVEMLSSGVDFAQKIATVLSKCDVVLAVVGPQWAGARTAAAPRIFDERDWVRIEIEEALKKNVPVIPVLVDGVSMPRAEDLPPSLRGLLTQHACPVNSGRDFNVHTRRLIRDIEKMLGWKAWTGRRRLRTASAVAIVIAALLWLARDYINEMIFPQAVRQQAAVAACNSELTLQCARQGGVFGSNDALKAMRVCNGAHIARADEPSLHWKDVWTTSVYSFAPGGGGPGGGRDDDELKVGGWGDWYFSLIQFDLPGATAAPRFAAIALYSKADQMASVPLEVDRIIQRWDFPKGDRLWWKDRPGSRAITTEPLPAPRQGQWYIIDLTKLVQEWVDGKSTNFGIQIRPESNYGSIVVFVSSDAADKSKIPRLIWCT